jgi:neutral ceramidase
MRRRDDQALAVGYGEADLEAPLGGSMPGYFADRKAEGVLDPLKAKALAFRRGDEAGAIVSLDLVAYGADQVVECRDAVARSASIPGGHVWVHATHTHTGAMTPRRFTGDAERLVDDIYVGEVDEDWAATIPEKVGEAVKAALDSAKPTDVMLGQAEASGLAFYRRFRMKDGTIRTNPGRSNQEVVEPAGMADPTVTVYRFGDAKALLVIFGLHPDVIGGTLYSADYPFHLANRLREEYGRDWNVLFLNAACGNINHIDVNNPAQGGGYDESTRIGRAIGEGAIRAVGRAERLMSDAIGFASRVVRSRLRTVPEEVVKESERILRDEPEKARSFNGLFAPAAVVLGRTSEREQPAEIAAMRLGPTALVGMPGEIFIELARIVQHDSPFDPTRVIGLTNGGLGYIPHAEAYEQGGYESGYRSARFAPGTGESWARAAVGLLEDLA